MRTVAAILLSFTCAVAVSAKDNVPLRNWNRAVVPHTDISDRAAFIAVEPCRLVDTRDANGPYGGPAFSATEIRTYDIPAGPCADIPAAAAYSLSLAVVSYSGPGWITAFPALTTLPGVSTVNFGASGPAVANAAIVPATSGSISVYARTATHVIIDINGYFIEPAGAITEVIAGDGLSGGGTTGAVTLDAEFADSGTAETASRGDHTHFEKAIIVAPVGTETDNGDALEAAIAGITGSSSTNRYLLKIEPGVYDVQNANLSVPGFVHVEGSGQDTTLVKNARVTFSQSGNELRQITIECSQNANVVTSGAGVSVRDATIRNTATGIQTRGFFLSGGTSWLDHVTIELQDGNGVQTGGASTKAFVRDSTISIAAAVDSVNEVSIGLFANTDSDMEVRRCSISINVISGHTRIISASGAGSIFEGSEVTGTVTGTATSAEGVTPGTANVQLQNVTLDVTASEAYGINNGTSLNVIIVDSQITTSGATNAGVRNGVAGTTLRNVVVRSTGTAIRNDPSGVPRTSNVTGGVLSGSTAISNGTNQTLNIGNTRVEGTVTITAGTVKCVGAYNGSFAALNGTCQ